MAGIERMPADDVMVCERACTLRTTRDLADHCQFFIYNTETRECQLLASNKKTCYMQLGPKMEKRSCFFSKRKNSFLNFLLVTITARH
jgi:hypothetical protein